MPLRCLFLLVSLLPATALAAGPPLETPANPDVPLGPVEPGAPPEAPPLLLDLPVPPDRPGTPGPLGSPLGAPDPLPIPDPLPGIPDLIAEVSLPPEAGHVLDLAPPFGGTPGSGAAHPSAAIPVPEPSTALLLGLGIGAIALGRRR